MFIRYDTAMNSKLRSIRTTSRAASVTRSEVTSAVKAVIASRSDAEAGRFVGVKRNGKLTERTRKQ